LLLATCGHNGCAAPPPAATEHREQRREVLHQVVTAARRRLRPRPVHRPRKDATDGEDGHGGRATIQGLIATAARRHRLPRKAESAATKPRAGLSKRRPTFQRQRGAAIGRDQH